MTDLARRAVFGTAALGAALALTPDAEAAISGTAPGSTPGGAAPYFDAKVADQVLALTKAIEDAEIAKDPAAYTRLLADDYTEVSSQFDVMIKGRAAAQRVQEFVKNTPQKIACSYVTNPRVQVFGDVAVLLYVSLRFITDREGRSDPACRRVTRIFAKQGAGWELTHSHFSSFDYSSTY